MATHATSLAASFAGELIGPEDAGYDEARSLFNGAIDKRPALIARCTSASDVQAALAYARENDLVVAVRGGGHSTAGHSSCDDGIVIDCGPMKKVEIDAGRRVGRFGSGLNWGEFDAATQEHGLAVTGGRVTHTGIAGLTLGSGSGWLDRKFGPTASNLVSVEIVTADGRVLRASEEENADLFWGVRGGGGNFGVVTEFEFRLHPLGPIVYGGMILHPREAAPELLRFYRDFIAQAPDEVGGGVALITAPPEEFVPEPARGQHAVGVIVVYMGDPADGEEAFRPILEWGDPWLRMVQPMPYTAVQQIIDGGNPWGISEYFKVDYLPDLTDDAIDVAIEKAAEVQSPFTQLIFTPLGGANDRIDRDSMALNLPDARWAYFCLAMWWDPADAEREREWARSLMAALVPWGTAQALPNFISSDDSQNRLRSSYGDDKFTRLVELKARYDPDNVFALNQNIPVSLPG